MSGQEAVEAKLWTVARMDACVLRQAQQPSHRSEQGRSVAPWQIGPPNRVSHQGVSREKVAGAKKRDSAGRVARASNYGHRHRPDSERLERRQIDIDSGRPDHVGGAGEIPVQIGMAENFPVAGMQVKGCLGGVLELTDRTNMIVVRVGAQDRLD